MMDRHQLQTELERLGIKNVYFQPPENVKLKYPACIYSLMNHRTHHADDRPYFARPKYNVQYITRDPDDSMINNLVMAFPTITHNTSFKSDGLYHFSYELYF